MLPTALLYPFAAVGCLVVLRYALTVAQSIFHALFRPSSFARYTSSDPTAQTWALVTGASDGIGLGFARELCARGVNVIIHGRNEAKLNQVRADLLESFSNRHVEIWVADAGQHDDSDAFQSLHELLQSLPDGGHLRILVNNVGGVHNLIGKELFQRLEDTSLDEVDTLLNVNARFPARLTTALLPTLCSPTSAPSLIINIGSIAALGCMPFTTLYNASKSFNHAFSQSLTMEMEAQDHKVEVLAFVTGSVDTAGNPKDEDDAIFSITPQKMAKNALDSAGCGRALLFAHWKHWVQANIIKVVPKSVIFRKIMSDWRAQDKGK
jgi:17beta-estradiol 17-dehydrogenase / very-long-chain 3-oxoacyl-CoA reductase